MSHLRAAEWINLLTFFSFTILACIWPKLHRARRTKAAAIGAAGLAITLSAALILPRLAAPLGTSVTRDWIPYLLLLMFYWQAGQFVTRADAEFEARLEWWDRRLVAPWLQWCGRHSRGTWILSYLELSYMFCYASLPLGLASLYFLRQGRAADHFWTVVLLATYPSYGMLPFLQTRPPRSLGEKWSAGLPHSKIRALNLEILQHASIHANTFPSSHARYLVHQIRRMEDGRLWTWRKTFPTNAAMFWRCWATCTATMPMRAPPDCFRTNGCASISSAASPLWTSCISGWRRSWRSTRLNRTLAWVKPLPICYATGKR